MTAMAREIARSERTLQSLREVDTHRSHFRLWNRAMFPQFSTIWGGYNPITLICKTSLLSYRHWATTGVVASWSQSPLTGRVRKSAIKWNCRRSGVGDGDAVDAEGIRQADDLHGGGNCAQTEGEGH